MLQAASKLLAGPWSNSSTRHDPTQSFVTTRQAFSWCTNILDQTDLQQSIICIVQSSSFWFSSKDHIVQNPIFGQRARVCICNLICSRVRIHIRWGILIYLVCENIKNSVAFVL